MPIVNPKLRLAIEHLSSDILSGSGDTLSIMQQIDVLVYHLYGLTYDEVLIIDPETPITREEYEDESEML